MLFLSSGGMVECSSWPAAAAEVAFEECPPPLDQGPQPVQGFAAFLQNDWDAVVNGLTLPWSSGAVEGQVTRIKLIKRRSYGRASFALLRTLVLAQPP
ncbi:transposase [Streptomyces sp. NPDC053792]|uniref:transposase n=1 Tax=Streptomyces sp. NPDC053792 TaxID=3365716 RepID=UPI0037D97F3C